MSIPSITRSEFTGTDLEWYELRASAIYCVTAGNEENLFGDTYEIWEAACAAEKSKAPYGDVPYADNGMQKDGKKRYPLDTEKHIRSAHSYFSKPSNYERYTPEQRAKIKAKIHAAWVRVIDPKGPPSDTK